MKDLKSVRSLFIFVLFVFTTDLFSQCAGLNADAGPDLFTCDPANMIMLQGNVQGTYTKIMWSPAAGLSSTDVLDPMVMHKTPGRYTYKLTAEGQTTTNLINNGDFESGNSGFSTQYVYGVPGGPFGPNNYGVGSNPQAYNAGFSPCGDHTSGGGQMMVVDGSTTPGRDVWCQTVPVVAGRTYLFEFWVQNVFPVAPSQMSATVNGTTFASGSAGSLCDWIKVEGCFKATGSSAQLCIIETSGVGYGNDFALDDIALFEKCVDEDEVTVEIVDLKAKIDVPIKPKCGSEPFDLFGTGSSFGPNITYEWSTDRGKILSTNGLMAKVRGSGIYTLKVKYKNGTVECEAEAQFEYEAPDNLVGNMRASGKVTCARDTLELNIDMVSGSGNYRYLWAPAPNIIEGQGTEMVSVVKAGKYTVTVTDEFSDCNLILDFDLTADTVRPSVSISGDTLLDCLKLEALLRSAQSDTTRYRIQWTNPAGIDTLGRELRSSLAGIHKLTVTDKQNSCLDSAFWLVAIDTMKPSFELGSDLLVDCVNNGVSVIPTISDSLSNKSFIWTIGGVIQTAEDSLTPRFVMNAGKVHLKIVNLKNGCESEDSLNITDQRNIPALDAGLNQLLTCSVRQITLNSSTNPQDTLLFDWSTPDGNILSGANSPSIQLDRKGWYWVKVTNPSNGCSNLDSVWVDEDMAAPIALAGPDLLFRCLDTLLTIDGSASSAGPEYQYTWTTSGGSIVSGQMSSVITVNAPGVYQLVIENTRNGCRDTASVRVDPDQNLPLVSLAIPDTLNCVRAMVVLSAIARSQSGNPLTLSWTGPPNGTIQAPSSPSTAVDAPGIYMLTAVDPGNGCKTSVSVEVALDTLRPQVFAGADLIWNCATTSLSLTGSASSPSNRFTYLWTTPDGLIQGQMNRADVTAVREGTYQLLVTDLANGCTHTDQLQITLNTRKPIVVIPSADSLTCTKTEIVLNSAGSDQGPNFIHTWSTVGGNIASDPAAQSIRVNKPGQYSLTILDSSNFCSTKVDIWVFENKNLPVLSLSAPQQLTCTRRTVTLNGAVSTPVSGFSILWTTQNGTIVSMPNSPSCTVSSPGIYRITVIDNSNGCQSSDSLTVTENTNVPVDVLLDLAQPFCSGDEASVNVLNVIGGERPLTVFLNNNPLSGTSASGLNPGPHRLRIVDANGCILNKDFDVDTPSLVSVTIIPEVKLDEGQSFKLMPVFGTPKDSIAWIQWSPSDFLSCDDCPEPELINPDRDLEYTVTYANLNGCIASARVRVSVIKRGIWFPTAISPNGDGVNDSFFPVVTEDSYKEIRMMKIFDRWGGQVFFRQNLRPNTPEDGWDGTYKGQLLNPGVYVWLAEIEWKNGETQILQGDLTILR